MGGVEIEMRARFDQTKYGQLLGLLHEDAVDLGENDKDIHFYVLPDMLLKVVHNITAGTGKISLKTNKIGRGEAFPEDEIEIAAADVDTAVRIFQHLGFAHTMHRAYNERHDFSYRGVEIAVKHSDAWGHHAEFEVLLNDAPSESDKADAVARIRQVAGDLGVELMSEQELAEFAAEFERKQAAQAPVA